MQTIIACYAGIWSHDEFWFRGWYQSLQKEAKNKPRAKDKGKRLFADAQYNEFLSRQSAPGKTECDDPIFQTKERKLLGFGPQGLRPGDAVCIALDVPTPLLLRQDTDRPIDDTDVALGKRWRLVGCCFVHGLMNGEGLKMGELQSREIC